MANNDLNVIIEDQVQAAEVITVPIDATLSISGRLRTRRQWAMPWT